MTNYENLFFKPPFRGNLPNNYQRTAILREIHKEKSKLIKQKKIKAALPLPPIPAEEIHFNIPDN